MNYKDSYRYKLIWYTRIRNWIWSRLFHSIKSAVNDDYCSRLLADFVLRSYFMECSGVNLSDKTDYDHFLLNKIVPGDFIFLLSFSCSNILHFCKRFRRLSFCIPLEFVSVCLCKRANKTSFVQKNVDVLQFYNPETLMQKRPCLPIVRRTIFTDLIRVQCVSFVSLYLKEWCNMQVSYRLPESTFPSLCSSFLARRTLHESKLNGPETTGAFLFLVEGRRFSARKSCGSFDKKRRNRSRKYAESTRNQTHRATIDRLHWSLLSSKHNGPNAPRLGRDATNHDATRRLENRFVTRLDWLWVTFCDRPIGQPVALHTGSGVITTRLIKLVKGISRGYKHADSMIESAGLNS